jgi:isochorismate pyruvate lyase
MKRAFSSAPWETQIGYCRAVRAGSHIYVSGSAPIQHGKLVGRGDAHAQARRCCEVIAEALAQLGAPLSSVVRTRMFVTDIRHWADYGRAHQEFFGANPPATSMVEVRALIDPDMLIEIEAEAVTAEDA